jgi:hypothetical protein
VAALERLADIGADDDGARLVLAREDDPIDELDDALDGSLAPIPVYEPAVVAAPVPIDPPPMSLAPAVAVVPPGPVPAPTAPATLSDLAAEARGASPAWKSKRRASAATSPWVVLGVASLVCLAAGFLVGRWSAPRSAEIVEKEKGPSVPESRPDEPLPAELQEAIAGRVMYKTDTGDSPDVGACVIALPSERDGTIRLSSVGLRPGDSSEDWRVARAGLRALGGDASVVDEQGRYRIALPESGTYQLLVLSRYQGRDVDSGIPADVESTLARFFDAPRQLIGQRRYQFDKLVRWNGTAIVSWGHTFPAEES